MFYGSKKRSEEGIKDLIFLELCNKLYFFSEEVVRNFRDKKRGARILQLLGVN